MTRRNLAAVLGGTLVGVAASLAAAPGDAPAGRIQVGPNVLVSRDQSAHPHEEVQIGTHPTDAARLVACSMLDVHALSQRKMHTAAYVSADGGRTWTLGPQIPESGDPVCGFGPDGAVYFGAIGDSVTLDPAIDWHFKLYRSEDGGKAWDLKSDILTGDRPWLAFDATNGPNRGSLYLTYQSRAGVLDAQEKGPTVSLDLTRSSDRGATWSLPKAYGVITAERLSHSLPTMMAMLSDGTVVISNWQNLKKRAVADENGPAAPFPGMPGPATCEISVVLVETDGWKRPTTRKAAEKYCGESPTVRTVDSLAIDDRSEPFRDRLYLAWADVRSGHSRILFTSSSDRGLTWSKPRAIDDLPPGSEADDFMPTLAVNKDGIVGITWNDRRENPDGLGYYTRFSASLDGGETWLPSVRVSEHPERFLPAGEAVGGYVTDADEGRGPLTLHVARYLGASAGDTAGLRADANGVFHALWIDNRSGLGQVYTASVSVAGAAARHGSADLAALTDVSGRLAMDLAEMGFDPGTGRVKIQATLRNKSNEPLKGRLLARVLSVGSEAGRASIVGADNGLAGPGAVFDFTGLFPEAGLAPKASTRAKTIVVEVRDARAASIDPKEPWKAMREPFVDLDLLVLGEAREPEKKASGESR